MCINFEELNRTKGLLKFHNIKIFSSSTVKSPLHEMLETITNIWEALIHSY